MSGLQGQVRYLNLFDSLYLFIGHIWPLCLFVYLTLSLPLSLSPYTIFGLIGRGWFHTKVMEMTGQDMSKESIKGGQGLSFVAAVVVVTLIIVAVTFIFLCCYHWAKLLKEAEEYNNQQANFASADELQDQLDHRIIITLDSLPCEIPLVYVPGHPLPSFIALPSPYVHMHHVQEAKPNTQNKALDGRAELTNIHGT